MMKYFLILILICVLQIKSEVISDQITLSDVQRTIDVTSHVARHTSRISVFNSGQQPQSQFHLAIPKTKIKDLSYVEVYENETKLKVKRESEEKDKNYVLFTITFPKALEGSSTKKLNVKMAFGNQLTPLPKEIKQSELQKVLFNENVYFYSVYKVSQQSTTVVLGTQSIDSWTQHAPSQQKGDSIVYGSYTSIKPLSYVAMRVHYLMNKKLMTISKLTRIIEISHWGNLAVEEHYEIKNVGPSLKGNSFSRLDYQKTGNQAPTSFNNIIAKLPKSASDIYYRDRIGNISTSTCRRSNDGKFLDFDINPRFPLFGGWKTEFYIGYNVPIQEALVSSGSKFKFKYSFGTPFQNTVVQEYTLKIIFPEGTEDIHVNLPFDVETVSDEITKTFFDTTGRPTKIIIMKNSIDEYNQANFETTYTLTVIHLFRKPLWFIGFLLLFCTFLIIYIRVDLTISKGSHALKIDQDAMVHDLIEKYVDFELARIDQYKSLQNLVQSGSADDTTFTNAEKERSKIEDDVKTLVLELKEFSASEYLNKLNEVEGKEKKKFELLKSLHRSIVKGDKNVSKLEEEYDQFSDEINSILDELKE